MKTVIAAALLLGISVVAMGQAQPISSTPEQGPPSTVPAKSGAHSGKAKVHHTRAHHKAHKRHHKAA